MRSINKLSARKVSSIKDKGLYSDGAGLYLQVSNSGSKSWLFRFMLNGKSREMGLGSLNDVTLAEARDSCLQQRKLLKDGIDPIEHRNALRQEQVSNNVKPMSFEECSKAYIDAHKSGWKNAKHLSQWRNTLSTYAHPIIGKQAIDTIDTHKIMLVIEPIWTTKTETASRLRGRIERILDWAKTRGLRNGENPARWRGHLSNLLPEKSKIQKVQHHAALPYQQINSFMSHLSKRTAISARGLEFMILTATRTNEVIGAKWKEIDFKHKIWIIPEDRMKAGKEHRIPLSTRALSIVSELKKSSQSPYVFSNTQKPLSNMAFLQLLKRMDYKDITAHGFRSSFRDWASEETGYPREVSEMALAHTISDKVEAAYRRGDLFMKRAKQMEDWAQYCSRPTDKSPKIVAINERANNAKKKNVSASSK